MWIFNIFSRHRVINQRTGNKAGYYVNHREKNQGKKKQKASEIFLFTLKTRVVREASGSNGMLRIASYTGIKGP